MYQICNIPLGKVCTRIYIYEKRLDLKYNVIRIYRQENGRLRVDDTRFDDLSCRGRGRWIIDDGMDRRGISDVFRRKGRENMKYSGVLMRGSSHFNFL